MNARPGLPMRRQGQRSRCLFPAIMLAAVVAGWVASASAEVESDGTAAFDQAMAAVAQSAVDSEAEARAMAAAIGAARGLVPPPPVADAALDHAARARAAARSARTSEAYLDAAREYGEAARLAPWVADDHFSRGVLLHKAGHDDEAARAFDLYLLAAPDAPDRTQVQALIGGLRHAGDQSAHGGLGAPPPPAKTSPRSEAHRAGETFRDCANCPEMVVIPAGRFVMGSSDSEPGRYDSEGPQHPVTVRSFALGLYDVTEAEYLSFLRQTAYQPEPCNPILDISWRTPRPGLAYPPGDADSPRQPAVCLSWNDAQAYIAWLNSQLRGGGGAAPAGEGPYHLPSEAEWEYAARAGTTTARWWGDAIGVGNANCHGCGSAWDNTLIAPAGSFGPNPFGLYDMLGNVWQWTSDCWNENYVGAPKDSSPWTTGTCARRVMRGGSWSNSTVFVRSAARSSGDATGRDYDYASYVGFRVARTLP